MAFQRPRDNGTPLLPSPDNLTRVIIGAIVALALLAIGGVLDFGSIFGPRPTATLARFSWIAPTSAFFVIPITLAIAFLCLVRFRALGGPWAFWAGAVFLANAPLNVFYVLTWPGLLGTGGLIANLPGTSFWVLSLSFFAFTLLFLAVNARQPERFEAAYAFAVYAIAAVAATLIALLCVIYENALPSLYVVQPHYALDQAWVALLTVMTGIAAFSAYRQYAAVHDAMLGYLVLFLAMQAFALLDAFLEVDRYDVWWYAFRFTTALAYVPLLFGFLQEGYMLFGHERERVEERERLLEQVGRLAAESELRVAELDAIINSTGMGILVFDLAGVVIRANPEAERLLGYHEPEFQRMSRGEWVATLGYETPEGRPLPIEEVPSNRALRGETVIGYQMRLQRSDGQIVHVLTSATPIRNARGTTFGAVATYADITALHQLQEEREDFIRTISHDLRNPLTPLLGMAQWLERSLGQKGMAADAHSAELIVTNARRINSMITDLVDAARLETAKIELQREPLDLFRFLSDLLTRVGTLEDRARVQLEAAEWVPPVLADQDRLERVVTNLLANAFKYSSAGAPVIVRLQHADGEALISVSDQGPGIPVEQQANLFERYYRAGTGQKTEGLGLGLYIARLIVEAHGGRIWVESLEGKGSTFSFALSLA